MSVNKLSINFAASTTKQKNPNPSIVYLGLGSNLSAPQLQIRRAVKQISLIPQTTVLRCSDLYLSKAYGVTEQPDFCNAVVEVTTALSPLSLLYYCQIIEQSQGHQLKKRWGPREIDIDIILFDAIQLEFEALTIPHRDMLNRQFVLQPLAELCPTMFLPNGHSIKDYLDPTVAMQRSPFQLDNF